MKKYLLLIVCWVALLGAAEGQNLIPNGDFEFGPDSSAEGWSLWWDSNCDNPIPVNGPDFWSIVYATPDRLLEDDLFCDYDISNAQSGRAWVNFVPLEAGKTTLLSALKKDTLYRLSYYASWETFHGLSTSPNHAKFIFNNGGNIIISPKIASTQWLFYDTIFASSSNSNEIELSCYGTVAGGVKLDNISLEKESANGANSFQNKKNRFIIFPNPTTITLSITSPQQSTIEILNLQGQTIKNLTTSESLTNIDISALARGMYFIKVRTEKDVAVRKFVKE